MAHQTVELDEALREAAAGRRAVIRHGRRKLAVVPVADLTRLEALESDEDRRLAKVGRAAWREFHASGEEPVPLAQVKQELGLGDPASL